MAKFEIKNGWIIEISGIEPMYFSAIKIDSINRIRVYTGDAALKGYEFEVNLFSNSELSLRIVYTKAQKKDFLLDLEQLKNIIGIEV